MITKCKQVELKYFSTFKPQLDAGNKPKYGQYFENIRKKKI